MIYYYCIHIVYYFDVCEPLTDIFIILISRFIYYLWEVIPKLRREKLIFYNFIGELCENTHYKIFADK